MLGKMEEVREGEVTRGEREVREGGAVATDGNGKPLSKGSGGGNKETKREEEIQTNSTITVNS